MNVGLGIPELRGAVEVFIQTGARTPLEYLLKPITDYLTSAMREE